LEQSGQYYEAHREIEPTGNDSYSCRNRSSYRGGLECSCVRDKPIPSAVIRTRADLLDSQSIIFAKLIDSLSLTPARILRERVDFWSLMYLATGLATFAVFLGHGVIFAHTTEKLIHRAREQTFRHILRQDVAFFQLEQNSIGALTSLLSSAPSDLKGLSGPVMGAAPDISRYHCGWNRAFVDRGVEVGSRLHGNHSLRSRLWLGSTGHVDAVCGENEKDTPRFRSVCQRGRFCHQNSGFPHHGGSSSATLRQHPLTPIQGVDSFYPPSLGLVRRISIRHIPVRSAGFLVRRHSALDTRIHRPAVLYLLCRSDLGLSDSRCHFLVCSRHEQRNRRGPRSQITLRPPSGD
jgi:ABC transporter transmembrane region